MPTKIRWLKKALRNLDDEASYIAADDPKAAQDVVRRIMGGGSAIHAACDGSTGPGGWNARIVHT